MSQLFKFNAYVISVIDQKRICVRIDKDDIEKVCHRLTSANDRTTFKDTIVVAVNECNFDIDFKWNELVDLIGVHIVLTASTRRYCFYKTRTTYDEENNVRKSHIQCKGVAVSAKKITNKV